ncbi:hypothetical protein [Clostridium folliculivorans]|uniref:Uncharacterized protein n=1 Tax=Clostridium folliculivorans TaxID=2886038 RepID=A0A9W6DAN5_9CLOT|nr:hypothetical protein [Clostridium folliculivorans]GKU25156.1 hypothetical protein CFOLD11_19820 [Clostridium folliculivorans]GKU31254.1 hypothetical protein CFB3_33610 [Clostridium folliculivorans]
MVHKFFLYFKCNPTNSTPLYFPDRYQNVASSSEEQLAGLEIIEGATGVIHELSETLKVKIDTFRFNTSF